MEDGIPRESFVVGLEEGGGVANKYVFVPKLLQMGPYSSQGSLEECG